MFTVCDKNFNDVKFTDPPIRVQGFGGFREKNLKGIYYNRHK